MTIKKIIIDVEKLVATMETIKKFLPMDTNSFIQVEETPTVKIEQPKESKE